MDQPADVLGHPELLQSATLVVVKVEFFDAELLAEIVGAVHFFERDAQYSLLPGRFDRLLDGGEERVWGNGWPAESDVTTRR